jgi:hypothetical protein
MYATPLLNILPRATPNLTNLRHQLQDSAIAGRDIDTSERDTKTHLKKHKKVALCDPSVAPRKTFGCQADHASCQSARPRDRKLSRPWCW